MSAATREQQRDHSEEDPRNAVLDLAEEALRTVLAMGMAPQMRARIARMPDLVPPARSPEPAPNDDLHLRAVSAAIVLRRIARRQRSRSSAEQFNALAAVLDAAAALTKREA